MTNNVLTEDDYVLEPGANGVWITVDDLSVWVRRMDGGVSVEVYPLHDEMALPLAGCFAPYPS